VPVAVGVTAARLDEGADEALQRVQTALELARNLPEGSVAVLDQEMEQRHHRQLDLELALRELDDSGLELVYQPKCLADGKVLGFEALLRWQHPRLGAVSPAEFIPLAERTGLMHRLTDFVLEQVCRQLQRWQGEGCRLLPVAINLSALDIVRPDIVHRLGETLARHHIPPALVEIEITETGLIRDERLAVENAQALRERGFALLIDDFGTGYSSLSKLNEFPVSAIKIDRSFIADLPGQEKKALIVKSILSLSRVLGCATVAEGVETREQLDFLTALGCTAYQGYYFHRPLPATTAGGLLERQPGPAPGEALMSPQPA
jgi:EAL domain-containing protein (putative c-di-GMP-specific phosphodiesterase class I)